MGAHLQPGECERIASQLDEVGRVVRARIDSVTVIEVGSSMVRTVEEIPSGPAPRADRTSSAAGFNGLQFLEMRAITDGADETAGADFQGNLTRSMPNLAHLLLN